MLISISDKQGEDFYCRNRGSIRRSESISTEEKPRKRTFGTQGAKGRQRQKEKTFRLNVWKK